MVISKEPRRYKLQIDNSRMEQVLNFKYLGEEVTNYRDIIGEIQAQNTKATQVESCLKYTVFRNKCSKTAEKYQTRVE